VRQFPRQETMTRSKRSRQVAAGPRPGQWRPRCSGSVLAPRAGRRPARQGGRAAPVPARLARFSDAGVLCGGRDRGALHEHAAEQGGRAGGANHGHRHRARRPFRWLPR
jgi:hypothetical protein